MKLLRSAAARLICGVLLCTFVRPSAAATFQGLGDLPGGSTSSYAYAVSADGTTVVGRSGASEGQQAFRWTAGGGIQDLGFPAEYYGSRAHAVSADGSHLAGYVLSDDGGIQSYRWNTTDGFTLLGNLPGGSDHSMAYGITADGSTVVGYDTTDTGTEAYQWTSGSGMVNLGHLGGSSYYTIAYGVSSDGSVIVGRSDNASSNIEAIRIENNLITGLGDLAGGAFSSDARAVSGDGQVVVGRSNSANGIEAFRWDSTDGMSGLSDLAGGTFESVALAASSDGSVIAGYGSTALGREAFIWTAAGGTQNLRDVLIAAGATGLDDWILREATGVSADGRTFVGLGINPLGQNEAWIATIPVPEPATFVLACIAAVGIVAARKHLSKK